MAEYSPELICMLEEKAQLMRLPTTSWINWLPPRTTTDCR